MNLKNRIRQFTEDRARGYVQTWTWNCDIGGIPFIGEALYRFNQFLCGLITHHELSATEWGYAGGDRVDRWCRWCNKRFQVSVLAADEHVDFTEKMVEYFGVTPQEFTEGKMQPPEAARDT